MIKTKNRFFHFFQLSKVWVVILTILLMGLQYLFAGLGQGVLVMVDVSINYLLFVLVQIIYLVGVKKYDLNSKLVPVLIIFSIIDLALAVLFDLSVIFPEEIFRTIEIVLRFLPIVPAIIICFFYSSLAGYKGYVQFMKSNKNKEDRKIFLDSAD